MRSNNPYRNYQYTRGIWDRVGDFFGFRTKEDATRDQMDLKARAYDAQTAEIEREEMYNSPEEQASRMRQAGINPDLESSGITGGAASPFDNQAVADMPNPEDNEVRDVIGVAGSILSSVVSIPTAIVGLIKSGLELTSVANETFESTRGIAKTIFDDLLTTEESPETLQAMSKQDVINLVSHDGRVKKTYPFHFQRVRLGEAVYNQIHSQSGQTTAYNTQGQYFGSKSNPLNYDGEMARLLAQWSAIYTTAKAEFLGRYQQDLNKTDAPEKKALLEDLQQDFLVMQQTGLKALAEQFMSYYDESNDKRFAYASVMAQQVLNGELDKALEFYGKSKLVDAIGNGSDEVTGVPQSVVDVAQGVSDSFGQYVEDNGVQGITPEGEITDPSLQTNPMVRKNADRIKRERKRWSIISRRKRQDKRATVNNREAEQLLEIVPDPTKDLKAYNQYWRRRRLNHRNRGQHGGTR